MRDDSPNRTLALRKARGYARSGNAVWAWLFVMRAEQFAFVSPRQKKNVQKLLDAARGSLKLIEEAANAC